MPATLWSVTLRSMKTVSKSLGKLSDISRKLANGDLDVDATKYANDEIGEVLDEYQLLIDNLRYQSGIAQEVADGDMTGEVHPKSEKDQMGNSLKKMVQKNMR